MEVVSFDNCSQTAVAVTPYYQDDAVTIYHADCQEIADALPRIDAVITDPPFFMPAQHYSTRIKWQKTWGDTSILAGWWDHVLNALTPHLKPTASFYAFCDDESYPVFYPALYRRFDRVSALVWDKCSIGMGKPWRRTHEFIISGRWEQSKWNGGGGLSDIIRVKTIPSPDRYHPVDKPNALLRQLIVPSTDAGDVVLDPFMGGGSTLVAAKQEGRKAIGIEIEESYCEVAARRMAQEVLAI